MFEYVSPKCRPYRGFLVTTGFVSHGFRRGLRCDVPPGLSATQNWSTTQNCCYLICGCPSFSAVSAGHLFSISEWDNGKRGIPGDLIRISQKNSAEVQWHSPARVGLCGFDLRWALRKAHSPA